MAAAARPSRRFPAGWWFSGRVRRDPPSGHVGQLFDRPSAGARGVLRRGSAGPAVPGRDPSRAGDRLRSPGSAAGRRRPRRASRRPGSCASGSAATNSCRLASRCRPAASLPSSAAPLPGRARCCRPCLASTRPSAGSGPRRQRIRNGTGPGPNAAPAGALDPAAILLADDLDLQSAETNSRLLLLNSLGWPVVLTAGFGPGFGSACPWSNAAGQGRGVLIAPRGLMDGDLSASGSNSSRALPRAAPSLISDGRARRCSWRRSRRRRQRTAGTRTRPGGRAT